MRALSLALLVGVALLTNARAADPNHLDRAATVQALERAIGSHGPGTPHHTLSFEVEMRMDRVDALRDRYNQLLAIHKTGHKDYRAATDWFIKACRYALKHHDQVKKYRPEFADAEGKFNNFKSTGNNTTDDVVLEKLGATKAAAVSYYRAEKRLSDEAKKAWDEGLKQKQIADNKGRPVTPQL